MAEFKIDLDSECIWVDERWCKKDELIAGIRSRLEAGNYAVAQLSEALEQLAGAVRGARVVAFRVPTEIGDALSAHAEQTGVPMGTLLRHVVAQLLMSSYSQAAPAAAAVPPPREAPPSSPAAAFEPGPLPLRPKTVTSDVERAWFRSES